jgi:hypothetical protein
MSLKNYPTGVVAIPIVVPLSDARDIYITVPNGKVEAIQFVTTATTGTPTKATVTITDAQDTPLSIATDVTQTAAAVTDATLPAAGMTIDSDKKRKIKIAVTFTDGTTPHWTGAVTLQLLQGVV